MNKLQKLACSLFGVHPVVGNADGVRATGRTTRLIDGYVQELFSTGYIQPIDHHNTKKATRDLIYRIAKRMEQEHPQVKLRVNSRVGYIKVAK